MNGIDWRIGTMGFSYTDWGGTFYPNGLKPSQYLTYYAQRFNSIEIDSTYHAIPDPARVRRWKDQTPDDFRFALKTPAAVTHQGVIDQNLPTMLEFLYVARQLEEKLAVVLIQLPPSFSATEAGRLARFLDALPSDDGSPRFAIEFRHASWRTRPTVDLLRQHRIAWVAVDYAGQHAEIVPTTDFLYLRLIGEHDRFDYKGQQQLDMSEALHWWADQVSQRKARQPGLETVWGLFNNDYAGHSPATADRFRQILGLPVPTAPPLQQGELF